MALELKKAQRAKAKLKLGISAPSGGGKTLGALLIAYGLVKEKHPGFSDSEVWEKVAIIDTENGSGELYVGKEFPSITIGEYNAVTLKPPFDADKYTDSIHLCQKAGMEVCIIDSATHLWAGDGGLLQKQGEIAKRTGNSYTAWRDITPQHNRFVETMLQCDMHIIATMRSETDYVQEKGPDGKTTIRKLGLAPIQKKGMEYEFTLFLDINSEHEAFASKDRTSIYDQRTFIITTDVGSTLMRWLESGTDGAKQVVATDVHQASAVVAYKTFVKEVYGKASESQKKEMEALWKKYDDEGNPNKIKSEGSQEEVIQKMKEIIGE